VVVVVMPVVGEDPKIIFASVSGGIERIIYATIVTHAPV